MPRRRKTLLLPFDPFTSVLCMVMGFWGAGHFSVSARCIPQHCCISPFWMEGWKKNEGKKKGASFSPYQLGKAMLCPCNCVGISSINSATLDNKYRVHRQLLRDLKRGCVKEYVCVCLCTFVHVCVERKN